MVFWGTLSVFFVFIAALITAYSPVHLLPRRYANIFTISIIYQVRWNVFVKNTDEPTYNSYTIKDGQMIYNDLRPFCKKYWFGLKRYYKNYAIETDNIAADPNVVKTIRKYTVTMPDTADIRRYINPDTLVFTDVKNPNVVYLSGKFVLTIEPPPSYQKAKNHIVGTKTITVLPVNIIH